MTKNIFTLLLLFVGSFNLLNAQCADTLRLEFKPDQFWYESHWQIQTGNQILTGQPSGQSLNNYYYCVDGCVTFTMKDNYGDGINGGGYYRLYINDTLVYEYLGDDLAQWSNNAVSLNCGPGESCETASVLPDTGQYVTSGLHTSWFQFTPPANGTYELNTCDSLNACASKIWVYNTCQNLFLSNDPTGSIFYSASGCANGAKADIFLEGNKTYFFRISYDGCTDTLLRFSLSYKGPIVGCTDPNACNYNPLASVSDTCYYPGDPNCTIGPDLAVIEDELRTSAYFQIEPNSDQCAVTEGCIRGTGQRYLVRFSTHIKNVGNQDYFIGETPNNPSTPSDQFIWDPCHNHWHYRGYAEYLLFSSDGKRHPIGSKNGFCVLDLECGDGGNGKYTCQNMGISAQCGDIYDASLPCQWIDITGLDPGTYTLVVRVNWDQTPDKLGRIELNYGNNWGQVCFNWSYNGNLPVFDLLDDNCPPYEDCEGTLYGNAQIDCEGNCNGVKLHGDWNQDSLRTDLDVDEYLQVVVNNDGNATPCTDLNDNNVIDLFDAALLHECATYQDDIVHWGSRFACQFPTGATIASDVVYLRPISIDTIAKTVEIQVQNSQNRLNGYEFTISGLVIDSLVNLAPEFEGDLLFNAALGKIVAMTRNEKSIKKNFTPFKFLRIHYSELTDNEICISEVQNVINSKYQRSNASVQGPCLSTGTVGLNTPEKPDFEVFVQPNPFVDNLTIFFENEEGAPAQITLTDAMGRIVRTFHDVRTNQVTIERNNMPSGAYYYQIEMAKGRASGRVVAY